LTPDLIAGVWVGCDDRLVRFRSTGLGQGAAMALPIWGKFFQKLTKDSAYHDILERKFAKPDSSRRTIITDCSKYRGWGMITTDQIPGNAIINTVNANSEEKYDNFDEGATDEPMGDPEEEKQPIKPVGTVEEKKKKMTVE
jgi:membrane carboxypeptidase/penicillin-binding protein